MSRDTVLFDWRLAMRRLGVPIGSQNANRAPRVLDDIQRVQVVDDATETLEDPSVTWHFRRSEGAVAARYKFTEVFIHKPCRLMSLTLAGAPGGAGGNITYPAGSFHQSAFGPLPLNPFNVTNYHLINWGQEFPPNEDADTTRFIQTHVPPVFSVYGGESQFLPVVVEWFSNTTSEQVSPQLPEGGLPLRPGNVIQLGTLAQNEDLRISLMIRHMNEKVGN